jgi:hypothetical protein
VRCERCGQRETAYELRGIVPGGSRAARLCAACFAITAAGDAHAEFGPAVLATMLPSLVEQVSARGSPEEAAEFAAFVATYATEHALELPPEVRAFVDRHSRPPG